MWTTSWRSQAFHSSTRIRKSLTSYRSHQSWSRHNAAVNSEAAQAMPGAGKGGKVKGPGGPKSDRVPARLSNGEFVMTAKAVRGAGVVRARGGSKE